jgi:alpha-tubulin suppressor-like RCC1 family protein
MKTRPSKTRNSLIAQGLFAGALAVLAPFATFLLGANLPPAPIKQVLGGGGHTIALLTNGTVWTWGNNEYGKLGNNLFNTNLSDNTYNTNLPQQVHGPNNVGYLSNIVAISAGEIHNTALKSDGTVWTWGLNAYGQLGDGTTNDAHTPVQVMGLSNVVAISARAYDGMALRSDGTLWAWGDNRYGELGLGTQDLNPHPIPAQVLGITNPASIAAAYATSLALMSNGIVWMWGTSTEGELGQGVFNDYSYSPIQVPGISNVVSISAGFQEPEALKSDGTIWMWGYGNLGQLGNGNDVNTDIPGPVLTLSNMILSGFTGDRDSCGLRSDHTVWTWGRNYNGQLGIGTADQIPHTLPVEVPAFGNALVTWVQTPDWHSLALEADGTLWEWGENEWGQLGNGTTNDSWSPTMVVWPASNSPPAVPITFRRSSMLANGSFQITFTNNPGALFTAQTVTSLPAHLTNWTGLGAVLEVSPGQFQFTDNQASTSPFRFYRIVSP